MLNELKEELEYCRRKWNLAREKNVESQIQWDTLRREFTARKLQDSGSQNSAESGFSDDPASDDESPILSDVTDKQFDVPVIVARPVLIQDAPVLAKNGEASGSGVGNPQLSAELRKKKSKKVKARSNAESLEDMFYRISGLEPPEESSSDESEEDEEELFEEQVQELSNLEAIPEEIICFTEEEVIQSSTPEPDNEVLSDLMDPEDEERRLRRTERFQRLEEQCSQLISQVMKTATRGNELNKQLDDVHNRYRTPSREATASTSTAVSFDEGASTSSNVPADGDTSCLTEKEQEFVSRRAARLKRLEDECKAFLNKVTATNDKGTDLNTKLDSLHEQHSARFTGRRSISKESRNDVIAGSTMLEHENESGIVPRETSIPIEEGASFSRTEGSDNSLHLVHSSSNEIEIDDSPLIDTAENQPTSDQHVFDESQREMAVSQGDNSALAEVTETYQDQQEEDVDHHSSNTTPREQ